MTRVTGGVIGVCMALLSLGSSVGQNSERRDQLEGKPGISPAGSGWFDLKQSITFSRGETLRLTVGGTAKKVVVRLLPSGADPNQPIGVVGGLRDVPADRMLEVKLSVDHQNIKQVSVHGGSEPLWEGHFHPPSNNGPATLAAVERIRVR
jgi:hypothetical protein